MNSGRERDLAIRSGLARAWAPFFQRFGRLTEIQREAIPKVLARKNTVVAAPTAGGKTEAAVAPLAERKLADREEGWTVIVSPTRALVNDLHRRLEGPVEQLGLRVERRTGDHPSFDSKSPPHFLITTPESFDSLLVRTPRSFTSATSVVIDELHLFDGTPRGDQLRVLCERIRLIRQAAFQRREARFPDIQFVALSATLENPLVSGLRYFSDPVVATSASARSIEESFFRFREPVDILTHLRGMETRPRKVLAFTRSRSEAELIAASLRGETPYAPNTFVHHGSLSKAQREDVEQRFGSAAVAICVATTTLELGIDIGDVDLVVLVRPPHSISSFLQRIGRGCRRRRGTTAVACAHVDEGDRIVFDAMLEASRRGEVDPSRVAFRPSVVLQQLASYQKQVSDAVDPARFRSLFTRFEQRDTAIIDRVLEGLPQLIEREFLRAGIGRKLLPGSLMAELQDTSRLFVNFSSDAGGTEIRDRSTGEVIGRAGVESGAEHVAFGGKRQKVTARTVGEILVEPAPGPGASSPVYFRSRGVPMTRHMADVVRRHLGLPDGIVAPVRLADGFVAHFWFLGGFESRLASLILAKRGIGGTASPLFFRSAAKLDASSFRFVEDEVITAARVAPMEMQALLEPGSPAFVNLVPQPATEEWIVQIARQTRLWEWSASVVVQDPEPAVRRQLTCLQ